VFTARYVLHSAFCPQCIYVFCVDLRTNSDYFTVHHWLVCFYDWDGVCLLRGTFYILRSAHSVFMCFVWIWEQTAIISLYIIDWFVFITETECLLRGTFYILRSAHSVFMCFVSIWEQTAIISLYIIDWFVFITETECVYCAVRSTFYVLPTVYLCVLCGSENKQRLFHWTALTGLFL